MRLLPVFLLLHLSFLKTFASEGVGGFCHVVMASQEWHLEMAHQFGPNILQNKQRFEVIEGSGETKGFCGMFTGTPDKDSIISKITTFTSKFEPTYDGNCSYSGGDVKMNILEKTLRKGETLVQKIDSGFGSEEKLILFAKPDNINNTAEEYCADLIQN